MNRVFELQPCGRVSRPTMDADVSPAAHIYFRRPNSKIQAPAIDARACAQQAVEASHRIAQDGNETRVPIARGWKWEWCR
jgi:hypothetical protein